METKSKLDVCICGRKRQECPRCGELIHVVDGELAPHDQGFSMGWHTEYKACPGSGKHPRKLESEKEVHEGRAVLLAEGDPIDMVWGIQLEPGATAAILELGAIASVERWRGKRIRVTVEEIPE